MTEVKYIVSSFLIRLEYSPWKENLNLLVRIKFLKLFLYCSKEKMENVLVRTKFNCSWARGGTVVIVRIGLEYTRSRVSIVQGKKRRLTKQK